MLRQTCSCRICEYIYIRSFNHPFVHALDMLKDKYTHFMNDSGKEILFNFEI